MNEQLNGVMKMIKKNGLAEGNLVGIDGNAYSIMGYTERRLKIAGWSREDIESIMTIATSSDYDNLLCTCASVLECGDDY